MLSVLWLSCSYISFIRPFLHSAFFIRPFFLSTFPTFYLSFVRPFLPSTLPLFELFFIQPFSILFFHLFDLSFIRPFFYSAFLLYNLSLIQPCPYLTFPIWPFLHSTLTSLQLFSHSTFLFIRPKAYFIQRCLHLPLHRSGRPSQIRLSIVFFRHSFFPHSCLPSFSLFPSTSFMSFYSVFHRFRQAKFAFFVVQY